MINRRQFLKSMLAAGTGACCAAAFGNQKDSFAWAQANAGNGRSLVLFNQFGGCDPLNSFTIPVGVAEYYDCLLYTSPSPRDATLSRMPSSA